MKSNRESLQECDSEGTAHCRGTERPGENLVLLSLSHQAASERPPCLSHGKVPIPENSNLTIHRKIGRASCRERV